MSQTADLQNLFQLHQILSLEPVVREWSDDDLSEDKDLPAGAPTNSQTLQNQISSKKPKETGILDSPNISTTSFDPGGDNQAVSKNGITNNKDDDPKEVSDNLEQRNINPSASKRVQEIISYASTSCGRCIVFISSTGDGSSKIPQLGSVVIKPGDLRRHNLGNCDSNRRGGGEYENPNDVGISVHHIPWYNHGDNSAEVLTCVTIDEEKNVCLLSCRNGSLFLLPLHLIFPGCHFDGFDMDGCDKTKTAFKGFMPTNSSAFTLDIFPVPKPVHHQRENPTALIIWKTIEFTVGIVGTMNGKVIAVELQNGKEVSSILL